MPHPHYYEILESGPDWITCTATLPTKKRRLWKAADAALNAEEQAGNVIRRCPVPTYEGWACGGIVVGRREDSVIASATGAAARDWWLTLWEQSTNTTRLDLAVTVGGVSPKRHLARETFTALDEGCGGDRTPSHYRIIEARPAGSTLYLGAPTSDVQVRIYDKTAESEGRYPVGSWRYEVQARAGVARALAAGLAGGDDAAIASVGTVHQYCSARGVRAPFRHTGGAVLGHVPRSRSDRERKLKWVEEQVLPTLKWLTENGGALELWTRTRIVLTSSPPSDAVGLPTAHASTSSTRTLDWSSLTEHRHVRQLLTSGRRGGGRTRRR